MMEMAKIEQRDEVETVGICRGEIVVKVNKGWQQAGGKDEEYREDSWMQ